MSFQEHQATFHQNAIIYGWPKALAASAVSLSGGLVAQITEIPWMWIVSCVCGLIPPLLKVFFDHRLKRDFHNSKSQLEWIDRLTREREMNFQRAIAAEESLKRSLENSQEVIELLEDTHVSLDAVTKEVTVLRVKIEKIENVEAKDTKPDH